MMAVWAEADDIVCVHPQGPRLVGFEAVRDSWMQIFAGGAACACAPPRSAASTADSRGARAVIEHVSPPG
jgi:hypothetical protein